MKEFKISSDQKQIIIGKLLGDGHMETANGRTFRLKIEHSLKQKDYVDWLYGQLKNLASSEPKIKNQTVQGKVYAKYWFNTCYSGSFRFFGQQFYAQGQKKVPKQINRWLTPLALAVWYMDDGSRKSNKHRAKIINTQSFDRTSLYYLRQALQLNFGIETKLRKQKEGWQIYIFGSEAEKFAKVIGRHVLPSLAYKLG